MKRHIPNILTFARLGLCVLMFLALVFIGPIFNRQLPPFLSPVVLSWVAVVAFVVAAVTDFFDGWLARKWQVVSMTGAILDPIADKVLVAGAIVGLLGLSPSWLFVLASGLILFREFSVSALREVLAPKGLKLPVTFLAKTKTTLQLVALAAIMIFNLWGAWGVTASESFITVGMAVAQVVYLLAALITVWTGVEYGLAARKALKSLPAATPQPLAEPQAAASTPPHSATPA